MVRVVRCPRCEKLLPELADFSFYRCGGCGAALQAKKPIPGSVGSLKNPNGDDPKYLEVLDNVIGKKGLGVERSLLMESSPSEPTNEDGVVEGDSNTSELDDLGNKNGEIIAKSDEYRNEAEEKGRDASAVPVQTRVEKLDELDPIPRASMASSRSLHTDEGIRGETKQSMDDVRRIGCLEQDQANLLRMLDELRDQLQRTCDASDRQKATWPSSYAYNDNANWFPENLSSLNLDPSPCLASMNGHNARCHIHGYGDPFTHRRTPLDTFGCGQFGPDHVMPYEGFYHQPACSCLHCYQRPLLVPTRAPTAIFDHQRYPYPASNHEFYMVDGPSSFGCRRYNLRPGNAPLPRLELRPYHRTIFRKNADRSCRSINGAAPFTICSSCFELLQLPEKTFLPKKSKFSLRCGSCFKLISVKYEGCKFVISSATTSLCSENKNSSNDSPQSSDEKPFLPCAFSINDTELTESGNDLHSNDLDRTHVLSLSSTTFGYVESPESVISRVPSLPLGEHFGYSYSNQSTDGSGNRGSRSNMRSSGDFKQVAAEMDLSDDENVPSNLSQDSLDKMSKDEVPPRVVKSSDSFFAGLIKKSFRPYNQSLGHSGCRISVNGHPISDHSTKKAEKLAGSIAPGNYWYDYRAGFWGVMGHQCLGMIPPFIEEFNYLMPKNCAGVDTVVVVNGGRELHQKDLELLVGRGLPSTRGCSYIIDISGKVWDESSGEELDCLGKLAPTVEKVKHGFGMSVPKLIASPVMT